MSAALITRKIWVTFQRVGYHAYPNAPEDVNYLANRHRHLFKFKVTIAVTHNEREIEYHQFLNALQSFYEEGVLDMNNRSCESIANELASWVHRKHPDRDLEVEVAEDGECGSVVALKAVALNEGV
jgi:hypothetical protein